MRRLLLSFGLVAVGCAPKPAPVGEPVVPTVGDFATTPVPLEAGAAVAASVLGQTPEITGPQVELDGQRISVWWDDGDTFSYRPGTGGKSQSARMDGYNTLESYGPVHRWGTWTAVELYAIAKEAGAVARSEVWVCAMMEGSGGYGRVVVDCPALRQRLIGDGLAHVFAIDDPPRPEDLALQAAAIAAKKGMWAKGAPDGLVTSLHSASEEASGTAYDRICSLSTGMCPTRDHTTRYGTCDEACHDGSCMVYVPFEERYGDKRSACLVVP